MSEKSLDMKDRDGSWMKKHFGKHRWKVMSSKSITREDIEQAKKAFDNRMKELQKQEEWYDDDEDYKKSCTEEEFERQFRCGGPEV